MNNEDLLARIQALVDEEHKLRGSSGDAEAGSEDSRSRLSQVEKELDQCWDLLRQRRAKEDAGESPQDAEPRPIDQVEGYRQ